MLRTRTLLGAATAAVLLAAGPAHAEDAVALLPGNEIGTFDTGAPATLETRAVTGLGANQTLRGIDVRPADGKLYGVAFSAGSPDNSVVFTYTIDPTTGAAKPVGMTAGSIPGAGDLPTGVGFDPEADRLRVVNANDENFLINPATGALAANDADLGPAADTEAVALAYAADGPVAIDHADHSLAQIGSDGAAAHLHGLGFGLAPDAGFDVSPNSGTAFAALADASDMTMRLYAIGLNPYALEARGPIGTGQAPVYSLAILPAPAPAGSEPGRSATAPRDATAPSASLDAKPRLRLRALRRGVAVRYRVDEACLAVARIRVRRTVLATARGDVPAGGPGALRLKLTRAGRAALPRLRDRVRSRGHVELSATDAAGNRTIVGKRVTLSR